MSEFMQHPWPGSGQHEDTMTTARASTEYRSLTPPPDLQAPYREVHDTKHVYLPSSDAHGVYGSWPPPEIEQPGLEPVWSEDTAKEVATQHQEQYNGSPSERAISEGFAGQSIYTAAPGDEKSNHQPQKRRKRGGILIAAVILVVVALALGLGLGFGLKKKKSTSTTIDSSYLSKFGAFNGSGIAIASESFSGTNYGTIVLYFQYYDSTIRYMTLQSNGDWAGGDSTTIVATDARNSTPISAVSYAMDGVSRWHIFYINTDNLVRERVNSNATNLWINGPIDDLNLQAMDDPNVGLQACWYGNFYGDANYTHSPVPGTGSNDTALDDVIGMHLWYGSDSVTLEEVQWTYSQAANNTWVHQGSFAANGHGGIACYSWGPGSVSYFMNVNLNSQVQIMWKDLASNITGTASHPIGKWVNSSVVIDNAFQNTSLGYTNYFYLQGSDHLIRGYNVSWAAENTSLVQSDDFTVQTDSALPGSHMSVTALHNPSGGDSLLVFDQNNGTDISEFVRDIDGGQWTSSTLPIPKT